MRVETLLQSDRFAAVLGARLVDAKPDHLVVEMDVAAHHLDASGRVSAGALFSLADCAMSLISNAERTAVAVATHFTHSSREVGATIRAVARPELPTEEGADTWLVTVQTAGETVASFTGTTLRVD